jgi:hypothetical protein
MSTGGVALRVGAVHIIESLRPADVQTGERLRDFLAPLAQSSGLPISVHFWRESTRQAFLERLDHIAADVRDTGRAPIVHLETHGGLDGLEVAGSVVTWADLKAPLTRINVTCRLNLLVLVGACIGLDLTKIIQIADRAPVWGLIGPLREVWDTEIEAANKAFYRTLFSGRDGGPAWRAMNDALDGSDSPFRFIGAEWMFREVMRRYFKEKCSNERLAKRTQTLVEVAKDDGWPAETLPWVAEKLDAHLRDYERFFGETKRHFFLEDLCPEHADRFKVSLEECLDSDGSSTAPR